MKIQQLIKKYIWCIAPVLWLPGLASAQLYDSDSVREVVKNAARNCNMQIMKTARPRGDEVVFSMLTAIQRASDYQSKLDYNYKAFLDNDKKLQVSPSVEIRNYWKTRRPSEIKDLQDVEASRNQCIDVAKSIGGAASDYNRVIARIEPSITAMYMIHYYLAQGASLDDDLIEKSQGIGTAGKNKGKNVDYVSVRQTVFRAALVRAMNTPHKVGQLDDGSAMLGLYVKYLINNLKNPEVINRFSLDGAMQTTPLHDALNSGSEVVIRILLDAGANTRQRSAENFPGGRTLKTVVDMYRGENTETVNRLAGPGKPFAKPELPEKVDVFPDYFSAL